jgi:hypothetical protein
MERENAEFKKFHPSQLLDFMYRTFIIDSLKEEGLKLLILGHILSMNYLKGYNSKNTIN